MGRSIHSGFDWDTQALARDNTILGPGDTSDSGSDVAGLEDDDELDPVDPGLPVDVALRKAPANPTASRIRREAPDIAPDHVIGSPEEGAAGADDELMIVESVNAPDPFDDEIEAELEGAPAPVAFATAAAPPPGHPNPEPDPPEPAEPDDDEDVPGDPDDIPAPRASPRR